MPDNNLFPIIIAFLMACIPAYIWGYIFYTKQPEPRRLTIITFVLGLLSVIPIFAYKYSWKYFPQINAFSYANNFKDDFIGVQNFIMIPISVVFTFMLVGVIEEYMKHVVVKVADQDKFKCIDDAIEYSIIAALGFAFIENIIYFVNIWLHQGVQTLFISFIFRSVFSTFAHVLFSGMYGYYYGMAYFSDPVFQDEMRSGKHYFFIKILHRLTHFRSSSIFKEEKITQGLLTAVSLHAFFNVMLEMEWTFLMVPFLMVGYLILDYLFKKKEDHKIYGRVV